MATPLLKALKRESEDSAEGTVPAPTAPVEQGPGIARRVDAAVARWRAARNAAGRESSPVPELPRPQRLRSRYERYSGPARRETEIFHASFFRVLLRLGLWVGAALRFVLGTAGDWVLRRDTVERRAQRLRQIFEHAGATFVKLGQQMSLRIDLVPYAYAQELEKMLDSCPPFKTEIAIRAIEEAAGKPISEIFAVFDPEPIASASIACVYQGILKNGDKVAIKVRRPDIGTKFEADIRGLGWLLRVLETFLLPPSFSQHLTFELRTMLLEELDFVREARYTELFRRYARRHEMDFATAPTVHFDLSNRTVLVTEFVTGIFLTELIAMVEAKDEEMLGKLRERDIDPSTVARQIIQINRYGGMESILFHADLHPGNILVLPGNKLVLIDFGSTGSFTAHERTIWRRVLYAQSIEDVGAMAQAAVALMEPIPPIDIDVFTKKLEAVFWQDLYAIKSKHSQWYERTTANLWIGFLRLAREYNVSLNINTLRMIRVSMLADTVALRLDGSIDHYKEYRKYLKGAGRRARQRLKKDLREAFGDTEMVQWEHALHAVSGIVYRLQRSLDSAFFNYAKLQSKTAYSVSTIFRALLFTFFSTGALLVVVGAYQQLVLGTPLRDPWQVLLEHLMPSVYYQIFVAIIFFVTARKLLFRLGDRER
jgi:predicted unusual protein kinase regulating ubiquinone biosynthesis (AarF/ABC1/UbiB family)